MKAGDRLGAWTVVKRCGSGGNGEVWEALHDDGRKGALKRLRRTGRERRARFRAEVDFLLHRDPGPGVLSILDACLTDNAADPAWYVMPIATPLPEALGDEAPLEERVAAIRSFAETLSRLAERGIGHRDLKPDNLFERNGEYLVGDFGLVTYPEKDAVTRSGRRVGPVDYMAPEMRANADTANAGPADVYALAKTAWVIFTGQALPLPGPHRIDDDAYRLGTYLANDRVNQLDLLLERCTRHAPEDRPTMADMSSELEAWLSPRPSLELPPLHELASRVRAVSELGLRTRAAQDRRRAEFRDIWEHAQADLEPLHRRLADVFPIVHWHRNPALMTDFGTPAPTQIQDQFTYGLYATNADREPVELYFALGAQWVAGDETRWAAWIRVEDPYAGPRTLWSTCATAVLGSATEQRTIAALIGDLASRLPDAAAFGARRMELRSSADRYAVWTGEESGVGALNSPWSLFCPFADGDAGCYVVDSGNNRIVRFGAGGRALPWRSAGGPGMDYTNLDCPTGGCFEHDRYIWVADTGNRRIRRFDEHGGAVEGFGLQAPGPGTLQAPADVGGGPDGSVYVVDRSRNRVVKFNPSGALVAEWGSDGRGPGDLNNACAIAVRHGAFVYVSDTGNDRVQKFTSDGEFVMSWGKTGNRAGEFRGPYGLALDIEENVYVADCDNHRIQQFSAEGHFIRCWGANGGDGSAGTAPGHFRQPRGVGVDGYGHIYVVEFGGERVQRFGRDYLAAV